MYSAVCRKTNVFQYYTLGENRIGLENLALIRGNQIGQWHLANVATKQ